MGRVTDLEQRYRGPGRAYRVVALVLVVALVGSGIGFVGWSAFFHGKPAVTSQLTAFAFPDQHTAVANFTVSRESQFTEATCRLRAIAEDHTVVGELTHRVSDGPQRQAVQVQIRTERQATSVDLLGCTSPEQSRPR
jgi:predicted HicB family RNase H-like nuclease